MHNKLALFAFVLATLLGGAAIAKTDDRACKDRCWKESNKISNASKRAQVRTQCMSSCR